MYERLNKIKNKIIENKFKFYNDNSNKFSFFNYNKENKKIDYLFDKKITINNNRNSNQLFYFSKNYKGQIYSNKSKTNFNTDYLLTKSKTKTKTINNLHLNSRSNKNIFYSNTMTGFRKNSKYKNKIDNIINELQKDITPNKNRYNSKIFEYKTKINIRKKQNLINWKNLSNKSFENKKFLVDVNYNYLRTINNNNQTSKRNEILYKKNNYNSTFKFKKIIPLRPAKSFNKNLIINQNNTNNYFILNYNQNKKLKPEYFSRDNDNLDKKSEENSIDINILDNSSILNN